MCGRRAALAAVFFVAMSAASSAVAAPINLVTNGDFSAGNSGFTSSYAYVLPIPPFPPLVGGACSAHPDCAGEYTVGTNPSGWFNAFVDSGDHTTGTGNMFLGNGAGTPDTVWTSTVNGLDLNTNYFFEAFLMNICCNNQVRPGPALEFYANNVLLGLGATNTPGIWTGISTPWNSGLFSSVDLELRNASTVFDGNDFALDDVYLGKESEVDGAPMPEPASLFLLGAGLVTVARRARRGSKPC